MKDGQTAPVIYYERRNVTFRDCYETIRQRVSPLHRKIRDFAKCRDGCSPSAVKIGPFTRLDEAGPVIWVLQLCIL
jgi:hypothetical protein